jgi:surface antigen
MKKSLFLLLMLGGEQQRAYGTACRRPDGTWQIVER